MIKIGVVGTPGGWSSEKLADAVQAASGYRLLVDMEKISLDLGNSQVRYGGTDLGILNALVIKKIGARYSPDLLDRLEILRFLAERGMPIFSSPAKIMRVLDRLSCTITLRSAGIPMPPTTITEDPAAALKALQAYGQAVFKPLYSTKARGMLVLRADDQAPSAIAAFKEENPIMYIQQKQDLGGQDFGVAFLGGRYMCTYARVNHEGSWNTTTRSGGKYAPADPPADIIALAHKAQDLFGLDFTCVDVALTAQGPIVFEVSAFGGFRGIETACGIDAAQRYVAYVMERIAR